MVARACDKRLEVGGGGERCENHGSKFRSSGLRCRPLYQLNHSTSLCLEIFDAVSTMGLDYMVSLLECCILFILMVSHQNDWHSGRYFALKHNVADIDSNPHFFYQ